jgi:hypothetical protein
MGNSELADYLKATYRNKVAIYKLYLTFGNKKSQLVRVSFF